MAPRRGAGTGTSSKGTPATSKGKRGQAKGVRSDTVLGMCLCGGTSPADALLFKVWEDAMRTRIQASVRVGDTVRLSLEEGQIAFLCGVAKQYPKSGMDP